MPEIHLTPRGQLRWVQQRQPEHARSRQLARVARAFDADFCEGLFMLAAENVPVAAFPTLRYWQALAAKYLAALCHLPPAPASAAPAPSLPAAELASFVLSAPPMRGGEYLSPEVLAAIWQGLDSWTRSAAEGAGGLDALLSSRAPAWRQVGRVCFHLAENRRDPDRPFAFLATYSTGLGSGGRAKHLPLHKALVQYAGARDKPALVKLLTPVNEAARRVAWVRDLVDSGAIYRPLAWPAERAYELLRSLPELEAAGLSVRVPDWWKKRPRPRVSVTIGGGNRTALDADALLDFDVGVALGDSALSPAEVRALLAGEDGLIFVKGQWVEVDRARLRQALAQFEAVAEEAAARGGISFIEGMRLLAGAPAHLSDEPETETEREWAQIAAGPALAALLERLRDPARIEAPDTPSGIKAALRPYQRRGVAWLDLVTGLGLGACLADDMGLGKTLQVLALLAQARAHTRKRARRPSLLVVPASLLANWRAEAERFAPSLALTFLHPAEASRDAIAKIERAPAAALKATDLAVTTYSLLPRQPWLGDVDWRLVILDEAQAIKNPATRQARAAKKLRARARVALTGTPIENRLGDLWSLFDFLNAGLLGSASRFRSFVKALEQRQGDPFGPLRRLVTPYILRRLKTDRSIIADLPDKTEVTRSCGLTRAQVKLYQQVVKAMEQGLQCADGMARRGLVLQTLLRLKQICNHPSQLVGDGEYRAQDSGKVTLVREICEELAERQERLLLFTQFREIIHPLAEQLAEVFGRPGLTLHGGTRVARRRHIVEAFQSPDGPPFLILSLKAGGTGLNLTAASQVIHFDRWWNPAVEDQATDRAFRIGQKQNVLVHKLVTRGTIEERIAALIADKRKLSEEVLGGADEINITELPDDELIALVRLDVSRAMETA